jgi:hypothetical protein
LSFLFGIASFGQALQVFHFVDHASREATRYAIVRGAACSSFQTACPAGSGDVQSYVAQIGSGIGINTSNVQVTTTWTPDNNPGSTVRVHVSYRYPLFFGLLPSAAVTIASTSQMVISQ